ncbi:MAG: chemotaxis protein [Proteobacteria bacterium]|nr:chemotaxis protein [Pseudomonadota bacterium]
MGTGQSNILLETGTNEVEILELFIEEDNYTGYYGVNVAKVLEIIPLPAKIMRPPKLKETFIFGMFNHRDKIITLLDLGVWLERTRIEHTPPKVLITEFNNVTNAFLVSGITRIHRVAWGDIKPLDGYMEGLSDTVTGVIKVDDRLIFILDLEKAVADLNPELAISASSLTLLNDNPVEDIPIKVLHADDSLVIRNTVKKRLEENKIFSVHSATNGDEAWNYMVEMKNRSHKSGTKLTDFVDIILSDIEMPGMDGYHLCKKIKEDPELKSIPVVLFSSLITDKLTHKGEAVGADGQFAKPDMQLILFMKELVEKRRQTVE